MTAWFGTLSPPLYTCTSAGKQTNCFGFPLENVLSTKSLVCVSMLQTVLVLLTCLNCYMSTLHLVHYALFLTHACWKSNNTNARLMAFALSLALDPTSGKHDGNLSHGKFSYSFLLARFQNPPFLRSLAVILNFPATTLVQVILITVLKR